MFSVSFLLFLKTQLFEEKEKVANPSVPRYLLHSKLVRGDKRCYVIQYQSALAAITLCNKTAQNSVPENNKHLSGTHRSANWSQHGWTRLGLQDPSRRSGLGLLHLSSLDRWLPITQSSHREEQKQKSQPKMHEDTSFCQVSGKFPFAKTSHMAPPKINEQESVLCPQHDM